VSDRAAGGGLGPPGSPPPADAMFVAGTDGTDLRALNVDASGVLQVSDSDFANTIASPGGGLPNYSIMTGVSDGTHVERLRGTKGGVPYVVPSAPGEASGDRPPSEVLWAYSGAVTTSTVVIAAPGAGKRIRLFFITGFAFSSTANYYVTCEYGGSVLLPFVSELPAGATPPAITLPLTGLPCDANTAVTLGVNAGTAGCTLGYTVETI